MGAEVIAHRAPGGNPVRRDEYFSTSGVYFSLGANLVAYMTSLWYDEKRDGSEVGYGSYQQDYIHESSFQKANEVIPWTLCGYAEWARTQLEDPEPLLHIRGPITQRVFDEVRDFIRECALNGWYASYSY